jgi:hypothetical protein
MDGRTEPEGNGTKPQEAMSPWPQMKVARAVQHLNDLMSRINLWVASNPVTLEPRISEDRLRLELRLKVHSPPPALEWSLILGDCLHVLRSALDACVWELAHATGTPPHPQWLSFPVCRSRSDWRRARERNLQTVSDVFADRIQAAQPFNAPDRQTERHLVACLSYLDNRDKHRSNISVLVETQQVQQDLQVAMEEAAGSVPHTIWHTASAEDGALVGELRFTDRIARVSSNVGVKFGVGVETEWGRAPIDLAQVLIADVQNILTHIVNGPPPEPDAADPGEPEWVDMKFIPSQDGRSMQFVPEPES